VSLAPLWLWFLRPPAGGRAPPAPPPPPPPVDLHQGDIAQDAHHQVIEIVGHATGQGSDRFELLNHLKFAFEFPLLVFSLEPIGNIPHKSTKTNRPAGFRIRHQIGRQFHANGAAIFLDQFVIRDGAGDASAVDFIENLIHLAGRLGRGILPVVHPHQFITAVAQYPAHRFVEEGHISRQIDLEIAFFDILDDGAVLLFTGLQGLFGQLALIDVMHHHRSPNELPIFVKIARRQLNPELPAGLVTNLELGRVGHFFAGEKSFQPLQEPLLALLGEKLQKGHVEEFFAAVSGILADHVIDESEFTGPKIGIVNARRGMVEQLPVTRLNLLKGFFGFQPQAPLGLHLFQQALQFI
jgi:hypothetical protein